MRHFRITLGVVRWFFYAAYAVWLCSVFWVSDGMTHMYKRIFDVGDDLDKKVKTVTLVLTESCNLACTYCYEKNKSLNYMPIEKAYEILDSELSDCGNYDVVYVDLFGGEPFLRFDAMKEIVKYVKDFSFSNVRIITSTNGTLVHGEIAEWLIENRDIIDVGLSLDGTKAMQDVNRSNSFDDIDLDFFLSYFGYHPVKMTVSPDSLPFLAEGVLFLHQLGFKVNCNLAFGVDWSDPEYAQVLSRELMKLIEYYLDRSDVEPCSMLNGEIKHLGFEREEPFTIKWCGTSTNMHTYDVAGRKYHCQYFLPNSIGETKAQLSNQIAMRQKIDIQRLDEKCRSCVIREACPSCYGANYAVYGDVYHKDDAMCELTKIIIKARAYFRASQWMRGLTSNTLRDEELLLNSIQRIQSL